MLGEQVLEFAAFDDAQPVIAAAKALVSGLTHAVVTSTPAVARFSSTEPASARTSLAGTQLLYRLA